MLDTNHEPTMTPEERALIKRIAQALVDFYEGSDPDYYKDSSILPDSINYAIETSVIPIFREAERAGEEALIPIEEELSRVRNRIGSFFSKLKRQMGYKNWPDMPGDFHEGVLLLLQEACAQQRELRQEETASVIEWAVEWTLKQIWERKDSPQSWDAGFPSYKVSALLQYKARHALGEKEATSEPGA